MLLIFLKLDLERVNMIFEDIKDSIVNLNRDQAVKLVKAALVQNITANEILNKGMIPAMDDVGRLFQQGKYFFPELLLAGRTMKSALQVLKPLFYKGQASYTGKYVIGTVKGDIHDIGKNIVVMMLEANGWQVNDLGMDVSVDGFCRAVNDTDCDILGMSALLTTTMPRFDDTIEALKSNGLRDKVKIMIGGAPVTEAYAESIGADGYARDAVSAVNMAGALINL
jgi:5-methyltetrahydrofolate--homocysteine methyltransferase